MTVVIFDQECDASVDEVIGQLTDRGVPVFRADTSWFPQRLTIQARLEGDRWVGCLSTEHHRVDLGDVRSIWYRDPTAFDFPANLSQPERRFAFCEMAAGNRGATRNLLWVATRRGLSVDPEGPAIPRARRLRNGAGCASTGLVVTASARAGRSARARPSGRAQQRTGPTGQASKATDSATSAPPQAAPWFSIRA